MRGINIDLSDYNDKIGFVGFQYTVVSTGVNKSLPTYQIDNVKYVTGESGGTDPEQPGDKVYTSSITLPEGTDPDANKASEGKVVIGGQKYSILKLEQAKLLVLGTLQCCKQVQVNCLSLQLVGLVKLVN